MFKLPKRMRRANRGPNNPPESRTTSFGALLNKEYVGEASTSDVSGDMPPEFAPQDLESDVGFNSECLQQIMQRPLDMDFLQPSFLTDEELLSIESTTKSVYKPLQPWQTRLLVLQSGDTHSPLTCSLVEAHVIDGPGMGISETSEIVKYEALSYAWGDPAVVCSVTCNGAQFGIALELATALQYLRSDMTNRYIWCDAICINQRDLVEKAHQVKNMLRIFGKAHSVIAWLGQACSSSGRLLDTLQFVKENNFRVLAQGPDDPYFAAVEGLMTTLNSHLASAWFVRTWVRQEVFDSKRLIVQFGQYQLSFETFVEKIQWLRIGHPSRFTHCQIDLPPTLHVYQRDYQHRGTDRDNFQMLGMLNQLPSHVQYWIEVLRSGSLFKVSDERDRIYGALGLLSSGSVKSFARLPLDPESWAGSFPIDYKKQVHEVFEDVTKFLINTNKTLEILDVFGDQKYLETSRVASWGIDWSREREEFSLSRLSLNDLYGGQGFMSPPIQVYNNNSKLQLEGFRVAGSLVWLDGKKEISHPRDRFMPKYRRSVTLQDIMKGPTRRTLTGLATEIYNSPYTFIFTRVEETDKTFELKNTAIKSHNFPPQFASFLAGSNYVFAYVEDISDDASLELGDLHLLVPRTATLDDVVVSLYGSLCLHLLRPTTSNSSEYKYLGPIAGIACGQEYIQKYTAKNKMLVFKSILKNDLPLGARRRENFVLV